MEESRLEELIDQHLEPLEGEEDRLREMLRPQELKTVRDQLLQYLDDKELGDLLEIRLREKLQRMLDAEGVQDRKIHHLSTFVEDDIEQCLKRGFVEAVRNPARLDAIAQDVMIEIGQTLQRAREELDQAESSVRDAVVERIENAAAVHTLEHVQHLLRDRMGFSLLEGVRQKLQATLLSAVGRYRREGSPEQLPSFIDELVEGAESALKTARKRARTKLKPEVRDLILTALDDLGRQYADPAAITPHFN
jgi:hypothetical protein